MCTAQRIWRAVGLFELYAQWMRTCLAGADRADSVSYEDAQLS